MWNGYNEKAAVEIGFSTYSSYFKKLNIGFKKPGCDDCPDCLFYKDHIALYKSVSGFIPEIEKPMTQAVDDLRASSHPATATASVTVSTAVPPDNHNSSQVHDKNTCEDCVDFMRHKE